MISNTVAFWLYLIFLIPSILCTLFILYHLLCDRTLRHALNNHIIVIVLCCSLICQVTNYPWMLYYYQQDGVWDRSLLFCELWSFLDWGFYVTQSMLFAWATVERHVLIFHDKWVSTKRKRLFVHYLPPALLLLYCTIFYIIVYFFPSCENLIYMDDMHCVDACLYANNIYSTWETIVHQILPVIVILSFSIGLLGRVIWRKHRMHQPVQWRKLRKMAIQLLSISFLYLAFYFPLMLMDVILLCGFISDALVDFMHYAVFFSYFMILLFPFVCALSLPELRTKFLQTLHLQRCVRRVRPEIVAITVRTNNRTNAQ